MDFKKLARPTNIIQNSGGRLQSTTGPKAAEALRYKTILIGLDAEAKGMRLTRGTSCTKLAKEITGLRTNDREKLKVAVRLKMDALLNECLIVNDSDHY